MFTRICNSFEATIGLGKSCYANLYGIRNREEAVEYVNHKILGMRLREITSVLLVIENSPPFLPRLIGLSSWAI